MDNFDVKHAIAQAVARADKDEVTPFDVSPLRLRAEQGRGLTAFAQTSHNQDQLAEGYALQGEYEEAVKYANGARLAEYERVLLSLSNQTPCECPKGVGQGQRRTPTSFIKDKFLRRGQEVSLWSCVTCGQYWTEYQ